MHHLAFWLLLGVVALAPLPLGANRPLGWNLMALAVGLLLVLWALAMLSDRKRLAIAGRRSWPMALLFLGTMLWLALQSLAPVPEAVRLFRRRAGAPPRRRSACRCRARWAWRPTAPSTIWCAC